MSGVEVLDITRPARRRRWPLLVVLAVVLAITAAVDLHLREREQVRVSACARSVPETVRLADQRLASVAGFVRPVLDNGARGELRQQMFRIVSEGSSGAARPLEELRDTCAAVDVLPLHDTLRDRRDRCVEVLDARAAFLRDVAADGSAILDWPRLPSEC